MSHACIDIIRHRIALPLLLVAIGLAGCAAPGQRPVAEAPEVTEAARLDFAAALADMQAGQLASAERRLRALQARQPALPGPQVNLAIVLRERGQVDDARALLETVVREHPEFAPAHHQLGLMLREHGRFEAADAAYANALAVDPHYALAHFNRAVLNDLYLARPAVALLHFERYQDIAGADPEGEVARWIVELRRRVDAEAALRVADRGAGA
ncbi:MAG: tetratricopeptide repeat protein [Gammaproteobacteria bacterium]|nr:tetratricopeptide repeat protein [Gammaproteobacteria bacterium]